VEERRCRTPNVLQPVFFTFCFLQLRTTKIAIKRYRVLTSCKEGGISVAVNGRKGRRVGCVLDSTGTMVESIDLEGEGEDMEVADGARDR
jgi:anaphase-promoting complex subunit 4